MMLDRDLVAVSPSSAYRVLKQAGLLDRHNLKPSKKGTGFVQPLSAHDHWHIDVAFLNLGGTFYNLCSVLDGYSRSIVHWEIRESMTERDVETIVQRDVERHPGKKSTHHQRQWPAVCRQGFQGVHPQLTGVTHVRRARIIRNRMARSSDGTQFGNASAYGQRRCLGSMRRGRRIASYVDHYNMRLHSALAMRTPADKLTGLKEPCWSATASWRKASVEQQSGQGSQEVA